MERDSQGRTLESELVSGADAEPLQLTSEPVAVAVPKEGSMYVAKADMERFGSALLCPGSCG